MQGEDVLNIRRNESEIAIAAYITSFAASLHRADGANERSAPEGAVNAAETRSRPIERDGQPLRASLAIPCRMRRRCSLLGTLGRAPAAFRQGYPGHADIAVQKGLTRHAIAKPEVFFG